MKKWLEKCNVFIAFDITKLILLQAIFLMHNNPKHIEKFASIPNSPYSRYPQWYWKNLTKNTGEEVSLLFMVRYFVRNHLATIFLIDENGRYLHFFYVRDLNLGQNDSYNLRMRSKTCSVDRKSTGEFVGKKSWPKIRSEDEVKRKFVTKSP